MRWFAACLCVLALGSGVGVAAGAQPSPAPAPLVVPALPGVDPTTQAIIGAAAGLVNDAITRNRLRAANTSHGTVSYFRRYDLQVETGPNTYRDVHLHPGTVINPRGATPGPGTTIAVNGVGQPDGSLDADTITVIR